jgi:hypothetical protein
MITQRLTQNANGSVELVMTADMTSGTELVSLSQQLGNRDDVITEGTLIYLPSEPIANPDPA